MNDCPNSTTKYSSPKFCWMCGRPLRKRNGKVIYSILKDPINNPLTVHRSCANEKPPCTAQPREMIYEPYYREKYEE